jgi:hypothetical protein
MADTQTNLIACPFCEMQLVAIVGGAIDLRDPSLLVICSLCGTVSSPGGAGRLEPVSPDLKAQMLGDPVAGDTIRGVLASIERRFC